MLAVAALATGAVLCCRPLAKEAVYPLERLCSILRRKVFANPEVDSLKRENGELRLVVRELEATAAENARLRESLGYGERHRDEYVAAEVLSRRGPAAGAGEKLRIGKGSLAGIKTGAVAISPEGLVGLVTDVSPHTATVSTIFDPASRVSVFVEVPGGGRLHGILAGCGEGILHLRHLKGDGDKLAPHSRVFSSGLGGVFPPDIEIGNLVSRDGDVLPAVDFSALEDVFVSRER